MIGLAFVASHTAAFALGFLAPIALMIAIIRKGLR